MVFLNATKSFNKLLGPFLLRNSLRARFLLSRGDVEVDHPTLDSLLLLPWAQKLISLEVHEECEQAIREGFVRPSWKEYLSGSSTGGTSKDDKQPDEATLRVRVLEKYLRPALVKNELWSDVQIWQFHHRLLKWARAEFLKARYGPDLLMARDAYPSLSRSRQLTTNRRVGTIAKMAPMLFPADDRKGVVNELPSSETVMEAFLLQDWKQEKDYEALHLIMKRITEDKLSGQVVGVPGHGLCIADVPPDRDLSELSLEEILEVAGGHVSSCGPFNALCEEIDVYQLWTSDYVERLGRYLAKRTEHFSGDTVVIDVGAGDGLLAQSLRDYFAKSSSDHPPQPRTTHRKRRQNRARTVGRPKLRPVRHSKVPSVIATDNYSWGIPQKANVERMSLEEAIAGHVSDSGEKQVIVLCSWMPMGEDWTKAFRSGGVDEYILIGEADDGQCGDAWDTWGNYSSHPDHIDALTADDESETSKVVDPVLLSLPTPYEEDGFERTDLDKLRPHQFSRFDCAVSKAGATVSFRSVGKVDSE